MGGDAENAVMEDAELEKKRDQTNLKSKGKLSLLRSGMRNFRNREPVNYKRMHLKECELFERGM